MNNEHTIKELRSALRVALYRLQEIKGEAVRAEALGEEGNLWRNVRIIAQCGAEDIEAVQVATGDWRQTNNTTIQGG